MYIPVFLAVLGCKCMKSVNLSCFGLFLAVFGHILSVFGEFGQNAKLFGKVVGWEVAFGEGHYELCFHIKARYLVRILQDCVWE